MGLGGGKRESILAKWSSINCVAHSRLGLLSAAKPSSMCVVVAFCSSISHGHRLESLAICSRMQKQQKNDEKRPEKEENEDKFLVN